MIEIKLCIDDIDYELLADAYLPLLLDSIGSDEDAGFWAKLASSNKSLSAKAARAALSVLPQDKKDSIAVKYINRNREKIIAKLLDLALNHSVKLNVEQAEIKVGGNK